MQYPEDYAHLIELQKLDNKIDTLEKEIRDLPEKLNRINNEIESLKKAFSGLDEELKKKEVSLREKNAEYNTEREKLERFKKQLLEIKSNDEYRAMLQQIENQKNVVEKRENDIIEVEEELEEFKRVLPEKKNAIQKQISEKVEELEKTRNKEGVLKERVSTLLKKREKIEENIKVSYLRKYERLRKKGFNKVLVPIKRILGMEGEEAYVCTGCNSTVPFEISLKVREGEAFLRCENCGRFLYFEEKEENDG